MNGTEINVAIRRAIDALTRCRDAQEIDDSEIVLSQYALGQLRRAQHEIDVIIIETAKG